MSTRRTSAVALGVVAMAILTLVGPVAGARVAPRPTPLPGEPIPEGAVAALEAASEALRGRPATQQESGDWSFALAFGVSLEYLARNIALDEGRAEGMVYDLY